MPATGDTALLSVNATGTNGGNHDSFHPAFSPDGSRLSFESDANDLGPGRRAAARADPA